MQTLNNSYLNHKLTPSLDQAQKAADQAFKAQPVYPCEASGHVWEEHPREVECVNCGIVLVGDGE